MNRGRLRRQIHPPNKIKEGGTAPDLPGRSPLSKGFCRWASAPLPSPARPFGFLGSLVDKTHTRASACPGLPSEEFCRTPSDGAGAFRFSRYNSPAYLPRLCPIPARQRIDRDVPGRNPVLIRHRGILLGQSLSFALGDGTHMRTSLLLSLFAPVFAVSCRSPNVFKNTPSIAPHAFLRGTTYTNGGTHSRLTSMASRLRSGDRAMFSGFRRERTQCMQHTRTVRRR